MKNNNLQTKTEMKVSFAHLFNGVNEYIAAFMMTDFHASEKVKFVLLMGWLFYSGVFIYIIEF